MAGFPSHQISANVILQGPLLLPRSHAWKYAAYHPFPSIKNPLHALSVVSAMLRIRPEKPRVWLIYIQ